MNISIFDRKGISMERLNLFRNVANMGGIHNAVGDDPTRQSLASRQLKELSDYVGTKLFIRSGRHIELTEAGEELTAICNSLFSQLENFLQKTRNLKSKFELGVGDSIFQWQLLPKMKDFQQRFPNTQLLPFSYSAAEIIHKVETNTLDAGIVRTGALKRSSLASEIIGEIHYRLFVPLELMTTNTQCHQLSAFSKIPMCNLIGDGMFANAMTKLLEAFGRSADLCCSSMTQMFAAVQSGQYAAVLPEKAIASLDEKRVRTFTFPELISFTRKISLIYKPDTDANGNKHSVLNFLKNSFIAD